MLAYERRARWIRRMQHRAARRRERRFVREAAFSPAWWWTGPHPDQDFWGAA